MEWMTPLIAAYAAFVSTVLAVWTIYRDRRERAKLKVNASFRVLWSSAGVIDKKPHLCISMTNVGRRPLVVQGIGGAFRETTCYGTKGFMVMPRYLPKTLNPGEYHDEIYHEFDFVKPDLRTLYAYDTTGKRWHVKTKNVKELLAHRARLVNKTAQEKPPE